MAHGIHMTTHLVYLENNITCAMDIIFAKNIKKSSLRIEF